MKAVILRCPRVLEFAEVPIPQLTSEEHVLIEVKACGICGSDLRYWAGENPWALHTLGRHVDNPPNIILGHEFAGVVAQVNSPKYERLLGKRVGVQAFRACGECVFCRSGRQNLCKRTIHLGHGQGWGEMDFYPGGYAEYCLAWGDLIYEMPDGVAFEETAMADVMCVGVHANARANLRRGGGVLCIGGGPIGLSVAQVANLKGAVKVFISEPSPLARDVLSRYPEFVIIDPSVEAIGDVVARHLGAAQVAAIYDSVGTAETFATALSLLEESGAYVALAIHGAPMRLSGTAFGSERTITSSSNALYEDVRGAYELIFSHKVRTDCMITHRLELPEYQRAFELLLRSPKEAYKVVLVPAG